MYAKFLILILVLLACSPAWATSTARIDIQFILIQSEAGHKAKAAIEEFRAELEKDKLVKEKELGDLKEKSDPTFQGKLSEYKKFMNTAQADLQALNDKMTNYLVDSIVKKAVNTYGSAFSTICTYPPENKVCLDIKSNKKTANIDPQDGKDITNDVLQALNNDETITKAIKFKSPFISPNL